jgi:putative protease
MRKIELLSPAGDMEKLKMSVLYGADAVYLAGTDFGMRALPAISPRRNSLKQ